MSETIIYVTGSPGFKSAVIAKLASQWIYTGPRVAKDVPSFSLPDAVPLEQFKTTIGANMLSDRNLLFFSEMPDNHPHSQQESVGEKADTQGGAPVPDAEKREK